MRNTKAKRMRNYLENKGFEYISCKKQEDDYVVLAFNPETGEHIQYVVAFADTIIIIQTETHGNIQFVPVSDTLQIMEIVKG